MVYNIAVGSLIGYEIGQKLNRFIGKRQVNVATYSDCECSFLDMPGNLLNTTNWTVCLGHHWKYIISFKKIYLFLIAYVKKIKYSFP